MDRKIFDSRVVTLENGIKLITIKKATGLASINAGVKIGSLYERKVEKGISHFIEHMLFKGTKNMSNEELNSKLEAIGGEYNAYTEYKCTVYSVTALSEELENSIKILSDMLMNSIFPEDELEKERGVILAEVRSSKDDVEDYSFKKVNEAAFKYSPVKYDTIGLVNTVKKFNRQQLLDFYNTYYVPNNCYITIVSSYDHEQVQDIIKKYFKAWEPKECKLRKVKIESNKPGKTISYKKDIEQCILVYAYTFHGLTKIEELSLRILNNKFGESSNSILFRELREKRGLAYDIYSEIDITNYVKTLYIYAAVSTENAEETESIIENCINDIKNERIDFEEKDIYLMKKILKTAVYTTIEDSSELGDYVLHQIIDEEDIYEFLKDISNLQIIKKEEIYEVARKVFKEPTIHILFPA